MDNQHGNSHGLWTFLPLELQQEVIRRCHFSSRATCKAFQCQRDATCTSVNVLWPDKARGCVEHLLERLPHLHTHNATSYPGLFFNALAIPSLTQIDLSSSSIWCHVDPHAACRGLTSLNLSRCEGINNIQRRGACLHVTSLNRSHSSCLFDVSALATCTRLASLDVSFCAELTDLSCLSICRKLLSLDLAFCVRITSFSFLASLLVLRLLSMQGACA